MHRAKQLHWSVTDRVLADIPGLWPEAPSSFLGSTLKNSRHKLTVVDTDENAIPELAFKTL